MARWCDGGYPGPGPPTRDSEPSRRRSRYQLGKPEPGLGLRHHDHGAVPSLSGGLVLSLSLSAQGRIAVTEL